MHSFFNTSNIYLFIVPRISQTPCEGLLQPNLEARTPTCQSRYTALLVPSGCYVLQKVHKNKMEQVKRTRIPSLPLKNILNDTDHAQKIFCEGLRTDGFVVLNIEECKEEMELMNKFRCVIRDYFSQSNNKQNGNFEHDIGYVNVVNSREIFQVRLTNALQWPSDEFKNIATDWYQLMTRITRQFLDIIAISLGKRKYYHLTKQASQIHQKFGIQS